MDESNEPSVRIEDDDPTDEQFELAFERAKNEFGGAHTDYESEEFNTEFHRQLNDILNEEALQGLVDKGLMEIQVREDGWLGYAMTPLGEAVAEAL